MELFETAIGRLVPVDRPQLVLQDSILRLLYEFRLHPQNPNNVPMGLSSIVHAVVADRNLVLAALDALKEESPPKVKEHEPTREQIPGGSLPAERAFSITGAGVRFVRDMPQGAEFVE